jgi:LPS export ABC transporter protein LptC
MAFKNNARLFVLAILGVLSVGVAGAFAVEGNATESDQQISEFSLAGYGEQGKKTWDLAGKSADIFTDEVKLTQVVGNMYGDKEDVKLTADKGTFDKNDGKVHLRENVVITTSTGAKLTTDSLDWDKKNQLVSTKDRVNIEKQDMITVAQGASGKPDLKQVTLEKDVQVDIAPAETTADKSGKTKVVITCDGPLEIDYQKNVATFHNNVKVDREGMQIYSDIMDVYFNTLDKTKSLPSDISTPMGGKIDRIVARKNVRIVRGENISYSDEATYTAADKKITLSGKPKLIIYSAEEMNAPIGN